MRIKSTHFIDTSILASLVFKDPDEKECLSISEGYQGFTREK